MAVIVKIRDGDDHFILMGTGFGMMKSARPSRLLGDLFPVEDAQEATMVALADAEGMIHWAPSRDLEVVSIDGMEPAEHLSGFSSDGSHLRMLPKSPQGVKDHPRYEEFVAAHESHQYLYKEDLAARFGEWMSARR